MNANPVMAAAVCLKDRGRRTTGGVHIVFWVSRTYTRAEDLYTRQRQKMSLVTTSYVLVWRYGTHVISTFLERLTKLRIIYNARRYDKHGRGGGGDI